MNTVVISSIGAAFMAIMVMFVRLKAAKKPTNARKIILPPFFMASGALMYLSPLFRPSLVEVIGAIVVGAFFSIFLIKTSKFEIRDNDIYLKRSRAFIYILVGLLVVRIALKSVLSAEIQPAQLGGMFFLLAFCMLLPWRIAMFVDYKKLYRELHLEKR